MRRVEPIGTLLRSFVLAGVLVACVTVGLAFAGSVDKARCTFKGKKMFGRVQFVTAFPDIKAQVVTAFPDLRVELVSAFPDACGKWEVVTAFPDIRVQIVTAFPDVKIEYVSAFPGVP